MTAIKRAQQRKQYSAGILRCTLSSRLSTRVLLPIIHPHCGCRMPRRVALCFSSAWARSPFQTSFGQAFRVRVFIHPQLERTGGFVCSAHFRQLRKQLFTIVKGWSLSVKCCSRVLLPGCCFVTSLRCYQVWSAARVQLITSTDFSSGGATCWSEVVQQS